MNQKRVLILECNGQAKPALCFHLEMAGIAMRVVTDEDEALNQLSNTRFIGEHYTALLVNNPYLHVDITNLVEEVMGIDADMPIVFVKESKSLRKIVQSLNLEYNRLRIYHAEPTRVAALLNGFKERNTDLERNQKAAS